MGLKKAIANDSALDPIIDEHLARAVDSEQLWMSRKAFYETGFCRIPYLLPADLKAQVATEVQRLLEEHSIRRDLRLAETSDTPRYMRNVTAADIRSFGDTVPRLYRSAAFLRGLSNVAGEPVLECPYEPEQYVVTHLERSGDTHGWHWDDYSFGVIFVIDCPPVESGGFVQTVPNTTWEKSDPQVLRQIVNNPIFSYELSPGDIYILRTDTTMHRVHPVDSGATRTIINMAYAAERDLSKEISHETMEELFRV